MLLILDLYFLFRSHQEIKEEIKSIFERLHSVVIGPGLGRDKHMQDCARIAIQVSRNRDGRWQGELASQMLEISWRAKI